MAKKRREPDASLEDVQTPAKISRKGEVNRGIYRTRMAIVPIRPRKLTQRRL